MATQFTLVNVSVYHLTAFRPASFLWQQVKMYVTETLSKTRGVLFTGVVDILWWWCLYDPERSVQKQNVKLLQMVVHNPDVSAQSTHHSWIQVQIAMLLHQTAKLASYEHVCHVCLVFSLNLQGVHFSFFLLLQNPCGQMLGPRCPFMDEAVPSAGINYRRCCSPSIHPFALICPAGSQGWWSLSRGEGWTSHQFTRGPQRDKQPSTLIFTPTYNLELSRVCLMFMPLDFGDETGAPRESPRWYWENMQFLHK